MMFVDHPYEDPGRKMTFQVVSAEPIPIRTSWKLIFRYTYHLVLYRASGFQTGGSRLTSFTVGRQTLQRRRTILRARPRRTDELSSGQQTSNSV